MSQGPRSETSPTSAGTRIEAEARIRGARADELGHLRRAKPPTVSALVRQGRKAIFQISASAPSLNFLQYEFLVVCLTRARNPRRLMKGNIGAACRASPSRGRF